MDQVVEEMLLFDNYIVNVIYAAVNLAEPIERVENFFPVARGAVVKNENYYEEIIPRYTDIQFCEHFRMSRATFEQLIQYVGNVREVEHKIERIIPLQKKLLFTIWVLNKQESFLAAGDRFGFAKSSRNKIFKELVCNISRLVRQFIRWSIRHRQIEISNVVEARSRDIPGVVGAIDGCHIAIKQSVGNAIDFYNQKGFHSVTLQSICDEQGTFTGVTIGMPGLMHDAWVFRLSEVYARIIAENPLLPANLHLIGDMAYPLMINLMKPYQDNDHLTDLQRACNIKLSSIRSIIVRAFDLLKCKFRRFDVNNMEMANDIILATCLLHNFIILQDNPHDDYDVQLFINEIQQQVENEDYNADIIGNAEEKRQDICNICNRK